MILANRGAGFVGTNFVPVWLTQRNEPELNLDKLTYANELESLFSQQGAACL